MGKQVKKVWSNNLLMQEILRGLSEVEVKKRVKSGKVNSNANKSTKTVKEIIYENVFTFFNLINFILAGLIIYVGSYRNLLFLGVVISNIVLGIFQELKAKYTIEKLSLVARAGVNVIRDGIEENIADKDLVVDDIIILAAGAQVPVDAKILEGEVEVNESLLTGESRAVTKKKGDTLYSGSFIINGEVNAKATSVGNESYAGKLAKEAKKYKSQKSEIQSSLDLLIKSIALSLIPIGIFLFVKSFYFLGQSFKNSILSTSAALIALIPGGLVLLVSTVFVISVLKLSKHKTLVQEMSSTETLARVDVLCLDKTGTLTEGNISLDETKSLNEERNIVEILALFVNTIKDHNPTIDALREVYLDKDYEEVTVKRVIPFSSERKYSGITVEDSSGVKTYLLGAPSFVYKVEKNPYQKIIKEKTDCGKRVLMLVETDENIIDYTVPEKVKALALLTFDDKVRSEAPETLEYFEKEGVEVKIISGDDPETAAYIAGRAGLRDSQKLIDATKLKDEDIKKAIHEYNVFGRVTPEQKQQFIKALKNDGHTVAMTGDGVNDVLALKEADVSVAMASGSGAARAISSLVLLDSNFASLPLVLAEGRKLINNLERSSSLYLSKTVFSILATLFFLVVTIPYPFSPIQLTLINSVTIGIPSFVLALEPNTELVRGHFFTNCMRWALPAGLTSFLGIVIVAIFNFDTAIASSLSVFAMTFAGFVLIFTLCQPLTWLRLTLNVVIWSIFAVAIFFFGSFFFISKLTLIPDIALITTLTSQLVLYTLLNRERIALYLANLSEKSVLRAERIFKIKRRTRSAP